MKNENKNNKSNNKNEDIAPLVSHENDISSKLADKSNSSQSNINQKSFGDLSISEKIKLTSFLVLALALTRIFTLDLIIMIGEIITSILVYFYSHWNNKCMAIVVMINGISGFIFSFIRIFINFFTAKSENFGYLSTMGFIISIFASFVYGIICYLAYYGFKNFEMINFGRDDKKNQNDNNATSEYGSIGNTGNNANSIFKIPEQAKDLGDKLSNFGNKVDEVGKTLNKL